MTGQDHDGPVLIRIRRAIIDGELELAATMIEALLSSEPHDAEAYMLAGKLAAARKEPMRELEMMQAAVERDPANGEYLALLGRCYARAQHMEAALACVENALARPGLSDLALDALAGTLAQFGRHREAAGLLQRAAQGGTRNAAILFNLGNNLKFVGDFEAARAAFERALELAPHYHKAHAALTSLGGISSERNNLPRLKAMIEATADPRARIHLSHAAAKECEALGRYDEAWAHLQAGKAALRAAVPNDPAAVLAAMDKLPAVARRAFAAPAQGEGSPGPIFIVGMPRSGTTVLDRILSNHRHVASIGESLYFAQLLKNACGSTSRALLDDRVLAALEGGVDLPAIGARYAARGAELSGGSPSFVDKFHLNFMIAGHVMKALPEARILCMVRNPLDTIVSNYRQLFEFESFLYSYSLDIDATADFYIRFRRLASLWETLAPERFRTVQYETLVADPDAETARLLAFCGLEWQEGCAAIERNAASVATASAVQVRNRIHGGAIGNWRRYEAHMATVRERLAREGLSSDR